MVNITESLIIPDEELAYSASRSSGPGGQNVNKVSTCVTLTFDVAQSPSLSEWQRARILDKLSTRITKDGLLRVTAQDTRSQTANKDLALERFTALLREAVKRTPIRRKTRPTLASKQRRIASKKLRAGTKQTRSKVRSEDD